MCYEFDSQFFRARALEALRRKVVKGGEGPKEPAAPSPSAAPSGPAVPAAKPETVPA